MDRATAPNRVQSECCCLRLLCKQRLVKLLDIESSPELLRQHLNATAIRDTVALAAIPTTSVNHNTSRREKERRGIG